VPPLVSLGVAADELEVWVALVGPARLSAAAQQRLAGAVPALLQAPEARQALFAAGWQVQAGSPEALRLRVLNEARVLGGIIREHGIRAE
jgi:tripartite-type tricarboxylate transporter receptor subunit TctC